jgi:hypothetical protein
VEGMAASILEAAGPFTLVGAQAVYLFQPLLSSFLPDGHLTALAELLEQPDQARAFAEMLREGTAQ